MKVPRSVDPARWQQFYENLQSGYSLAHAARKAGISDPTARTFVREWRSTTLHPNLRTSSGWRWLGSRPEQAPDRKETRP